MKPVSLADISYEQGLELLSLRKQALDSGEAKRLPSDVLRKSHMLQRIGEKAAAEGGFLDNLTGSLNNITSSAKGYLKNMDPALKRTLLTGATGAGLGAVGGAFADNKNRLRNMLMGGIAGGALGGGIGLASNPGVLDKAIDSAVPSFKDRARSAVGGGASGPAGPAKPGELSEFGIDITPERMAEIEANRLPNLANPLDNNLSQIEPYATGGGALAGSEYLRRKFAPQVVDAEKAGPGLFQAAQKAVGKDPTGTAEKLMQALRGQNVSSKDIQRIVSSNNADDLIRAISKAGLSPQKVQQMALALGEKDLATTLAKATKPMGYGQAAKSLVRRSPVKGRAALLIPALLGAYGLTRIGSGAGEQIKNQVVWNKLKNRLEQVAE